MEIVLNVEVDLTDVAIAIRKTANGTYNICDGLVYTFSLKQNGYAVEVYEYIKHTGDKSILETAMPTMLRIMNSFKSRIEENNLIRQFVLTNKFI